MGSDFTCTTCWKGFGYPMCVACHDARRESIESRARTEGAKAERERIVAIVDQITSFEVNACTHHAESLKATHSKARVPLHRMHECAAKQSLALGSIIRGAILSGDWKPITSGGG